MARRSRPSRSKSGKTSRSSGRKASGPRVSSRRIRKEAKKAGRPPKRVKKKKSQRRIRFGPVLTLSVGAAMVWLAVWLLWSPQASGPSPVAVKPAPATGSPRTGGSMVSLAPVRAGVLPASATSPEFEARPHAFQRRLSILDTAVDVGLKRAGISAEEVAFTRARNEYQAGIHYELVETEVELGDRDPEAIEESLLEALAHIGPAGATLTGGEVGRARMLELRLDGKLVRVIRFNGRRPQALVSARAAIIIDDLGYHPEQDRAVLDLGLKLTVAILPHGPSAEALAASAREKGLEVMLHLPMEPHGYPKVDPGPGALLMGMKAGQIEELITDNLARVPGAGGVNNHMGSRLTESRPEMKTVMRVLRRRGLFFIDSKTSPRSVGEATAKWADVPYAQRTVFLDNVPQVEAVAAQLRRLMARAEAHGQAIAIGHPYPATIKALEQAAEQLAARVDLVPVSQLVR